MRQRPTFFFAASWAFLSFVIAGSLSNASPVPRDIQNVDSSARGPYFGLNPPTAIPERFAPGIINLPGRSVGRIAFSGDGTQCAFTVFESVYQNNRILLTRYENGAWTPATPLTAPAGRECLEPLFSRDGRQIYFGATSTGDSPNVDFWVTQRTAQGWGEPQPLPAPLNSSQNEFCLSQTADGTMYFASLRNGGHGGLDLYRTITKTGQPMQVENLGLAVNCEFDDGDPGISPDGRTLVFYSAANRHRGSGGSDLFISFADAHGDWSKPVNLGPGYNTPVAEYAATFSQDGQALFFVRFDGEKGEVYWVSTTALERFRNAPQATDGVEETVTAPERKTVLVPGSVLQRYVGTYAAETKTGLTTHVTREGDQLMLQVSGQPKVPLFAQSESKFFLKVAEVEFEFVQNDQGEITDLIVHQNGLNFKIPRQKNAGDGPRT